MSFGVSPSDIIKLVEFSTRIYVAFKGSDGPWRSAPISGVEPG
jgi:hypothetical protein